MKTTDLSITEIAERVGFEDYNYFSRVFKKETGDSARKYRDLFSFVTADELPPTLFAHPGSPDCFNIETHAPVVANYF